jgi:putative nucleotidyltransferase with HDIG domain
MLNIIETLASGEHNIFEKFRELAPGSFKHCQNVSNICENIGKTLELNVPLLKAAALTHDIGKMYNPEYFSENQEETNPHDDLDPLISYQLITKHVGDSILILMTIPDIPIELLSIIASHHGDTILQSICNKTKNKIEDNFRYKCRKPSTAEGAILMIADSIEASARAHYNQGKLEDSKSKQKLVNTTIERLGDDGQLDIVKFGVIRETKVILIKELESIYHKRVSYEEEEKEDE